MSNIRRATLPPTPQPIGPWRELSQQADVRDLIGDSKVYQRDLSDGHLTVFVTLDDGMWHLSISHRLNLPGNPPGRIPSWDEIKDARYRFLPDEVTMAMLLPPRAEYVNVHETTMHLHQLNVE